jgi:hypothetical protein
MQLVLYKIQPSLALHQSLLGSWAAICFPQTCMLLTTSFPIHILLALPHTEELACGISGICYHPWLGLQVLLCSKQNNLPLTPRHKDVHILISRSCDYSILRDKGEVRVQMVLRLLISGPYAWLLQWAQNSHEILLSWPELASWRAHPPIGVSATAHLLTGKTNP